MDCQVTIVLLHFEEATHWKITKINNPWKGMTRNLAPGYLDKHILREKWLTIITEEKRGHLEQNPKRHKEIFQLFVLVEINSFLTEWTKKTTKHEFVNFLWILGKEWYNGAVSNSVHFCLHHPIYHTFNIVKQTRQLYYLQLVISPSVWKSHWTSSLRYEEISQDTHT